MSYNADSIIRLPILSGRIPKEKQDEIKEKSDERQLKKFRKKGFTIIPPEEDEEYVVDGECVDVEESKEKEK